MELELEAGDDAEVPTAATQPPEKIAVFRFAGTHLLAIRQHDIRGQQVVNGHAVFPAQPAKAATKRQAGHAGGRIDAQGRREAVCLSGRIEVGEEASGIDVGPTGVRIDFDVLHQ